MQQQRTSRTLSSFHRANSTKISSNCWMKKTEKARSTTGKPLREKRLLLRRTTIRRSSIISTKESQKPTGWAWTTDTCFVMAKTRTSLLLFTSSTMPKTKPHWPMQKCCRVRLCRITTCWMLTRPGNRPAMPTMPWRTWKIKWLFRLLNTSTLAGSR